ncbi:MAG: SIS domain-containing protein, partial [Magnetovibrio sp.]|nr:SIS domain-containing protein [Magnetovibrio sp.]
MAHSTALDDAKLTDRDADADLASARLVLKVEQDGLAALSDSLGKPFVKALDLIEAANGRVVITGMGKSGHVSKKIAATMASTGQPAFFVHPGEASHGDLGMVLQGDVVIALSNSGETSELSDIIAYTRRYGIGLIAMTGGQNSTLAKAAKDFGLDAKWENTAAQKKMDRFNKRRETT